MPENEYEYISDEMLAAVGKEGSPTTFEVDKTMIRMFARAVGYTDPVYYDEKAAQAAGYRSLPCPPGYLGTPVFNPKRESSGPGPMSFGPAPKKPLTRLLNGGTQLEFFGDICAGDVLTSTGHLAEIAETKGSLGTMVVMTNKSVYKNQDGEVVAISTGTVLRY
ncbi:MAG: MaoC family dehydratase N-terminal domain-containing protein [Dehalococcoidia bacterium]|nr:MaoC family dehydratase N-terminal domain-containing protein [Dehalococcoidia bacterium]MCA9844891.1 MaoC family dehydratase N-terminal domain-containing protein [Dehalococcoidia bacterium]